MNNNERAVSAWLLDRVEDALDDLLADRDARLALAAELAEEDLRDAGVEPGLSREEIARALAEQSRAVYSTEEKKQH